MDSEGYTNISMHIYIYSMYIDCIYLYVCIINKRRPWVWKGLGHKNSSKEREQREIIYTNIYEYTYLKL